MCSCSSVCRERDEPWWINMKITCTSAALSLFPFPIWFFWSEGMAEGKKSCIFQTGASGHCVCVSVLCVCVWLRARWTIPLCVSPSVCVRRRWCRCGCVGERALGEGIVWECSLASWESLQSHVAGSLLFYSASSVRAAVITPSSAARTLRAAALERAYSPSRFPLVPTWPSKTIMSRFQFIPIRAPHLNGCKTKKKG